MMNRLIRHRNLIILLWCVFILIIFKIATNFVFQHGSAYLFIISFLSVPVYLTLASSKRSKTLREMRLAKQAGFFNRIRFDYNNGTFQQQLLNSLMKQYGKPQTQIDDEEIKLYLGKKAQLLVSFTVEKTTLIIVDTFITYRFFYTKAYYDLNKYDERGFEFSDPEHLYQRILGIIDKLMGKTYQYEEVYFGKQYAACRLKLGDEIVYQIIEKEKKGFFQKETIVERTIEL